MCDPILVTLFFKIFNSMTICDSRKERFELYFVYLPSVVFVQAV